MLVSVWHGSAWQGKALAQHSSARQILDRCLAQFSIVWRSTASLVLAGLNTARHGSAQHSAFPVRPCPPVALPGSSAHCGGTWASLSHIPGCWSDAPICVMILYIFIPSGPLFSLMENTDEPRAFHGLKSHPSRSATQRDGKWKSRQENARNEEGSRAPITAGGNLSPLQRVSGGPSVTCVGNQRGVDGTWQRCQT